MFNHKCYSLARRVPARGHLLASTALALTIAATDAALAEQESYTIPAQSVEGALKSFAEQADVQIIYAEGDIARIESSGVSGATSAEQAIGQLLSGTGLVFEFERENLLIVRLASETAARDGRIKLNAVFPDSGRGQLALVVDAGQRSSQATNFGSPQVAGAGFYEDEDEDIEEQLPESDKYLELEGREVWPLGYLIAKELTYTVEKALWLTTKKPNPLAYFR